MRSAAQCGLLPSLPFANSVKFDERHAELLRYFAAGYRAAARLNHPDHALAKAGEFPDLCRVCGKMECVSWWYHSLSLCHKGEELIPSREGGLFLIGTQRLSDGKQ